MSLLGLERQPHNYAVGERELSERKAWLLFYYRREKWLKKRIFKAENGKAPTKFLRDSKIKLQAKGLYSVMHSYSQPKELMLNPKTFVSLKTLAEDTGLRVFCSRGRGEKRWSYGENIGWFLFSALQPCQSVAFQRELKIPLEA